MLNHLNLLPLSFRARQLVSTYVRAWGLVWLLCAVGIGYGCFHRWNHLLILEQDAAFAAVSSQPIRDFQSEHRAIIKDIEKIEERESWLTDSDSREAMQIIGIISHSAGATHGRVSVQNLELNAIERTAVARKDPEQPQTKQEPVIEQRMQLDLTGIADDDLAVASFVAGLRDSGVFESVELKSSFTQIFDEHNSREYNVSCIY